MARARLLVAIQHATAIDWQVEPFVRIERDRIGFGQSIEQAPRRIRQGRESAVTGIDVHPEIESPRHLAYFRERVERAGRHRARIGHHAKRQMPRLEVFRYFCDQIVDADLEALVHPDRAHVITSETQQRRGFGDRMVGFI